MKLTALGKTIATAAKIAFVGIPEATTIQDRNGKPYFQWSLKQPVLVGCSVNKDVISAEFDHLFVRQDLLESDLWEFMNGKDDTDGVHIPGFVADFSINQEIPIYQDTSISKWSRADRGVRRASHAVEVNSKLAKMLEERKSK